MSSLNHQHWYFLFLILLLKLLLIKSSLLEEQQLFETNKFKLYKKNQWTKHLVSRTRRSLNDDFNKQQQLVFNSPQSNQQTQQQQQQQRPCPSGCTCSYDTVNCNELINECHECVHWHQIDFNQVTQMKPHTFKHFKFAPNRTTHIIIYKLLNSSLAESIFDNLRVPSNAQLEITFQYNSVIRLDKYALTGVQLASNSTLVFNFPYTTQVVFVAKCFHGVHMSDHLSRLIVRILKSFSVRFVGETNYNTNYWKTARLLDNDSVKNWSIHTGQFIIDIKSTHLVKFEDNSFSRLELHNQAKFYLDLDIIEKLMIQRNSFSHLSLVAASKMILYAKHITFIDFKAYSFAHITLADEAKLQIYLEELISSICLQRNVFSFLRLNAAHTHFNFSIINSKNVMLMHDSFSNIEINSPSSRLFIGVFNSPSYLLKLKTSSSYYQSFIKERLIYKWTNTNNNNDQYDQYSSHYAAPFSLTNSEYFYSANGLTAANLFNLDNLKNFYLTNKQSYSYNVSIERSCFSNLSFNYASSNVNNLNVWIAVDNAKTLLVDDYIVDYSHANTSSSLLNSNLNFLLNVKYFVLSPNALQNLHRIRVEFLTEPSLIKFGLVASRNLLRHVYIIGLNKLMPYSLSNNSINDEQDNLDDPFNENLNNNNRLIKTKMTLIDDFCHLAFQSDTKFTIQSRATDLEECTCSLVYFYLNQLKSFKTQTSFLNCNLKDLNFVLECRKQLEMECGSAAVVSGAYKQDYLSEFVKFWEYCITELEHSSLDQHLKSNSPYSNPDLDTGNLYFNNFNDPDGMFSASLSSSSSIFDQPLDSFNKPALQPSHSTNNQVSSSNANTFASNLGKIIGIVIVSFLSGIILFMIVINIIQYKFRNELLDDLDYSSQPNLNAQNGVVPTGGASQSSDEDQNEQNHATHVSLSKKKHEKIKFIRNDSIITELNESEQTNNKNEYYEEEEDEEEEEEVESYDKQKYESDSLFNEEEYDHEEECVYGSAPAKKLRRQHSVTASNRLTKTKLSQDSGILESDRASTPPPPYEENASSCKQLQQKQTNKNFFKNNKVSLA